MQSLVSGVTPASLCAGLGHLSTHEGGKAVRCAAEGTSLCQAAAKAAALFDKTAPASVPAEHQYFDIAFSECTASVYKKVCMEFATKIFMNAEKLRAIGHLLVKGTVVLHYAVLLPSLVHSTLNDCRCQPKMLSMCSYEMASCILLQQVRALFFVG